MKCPVWHPSRRNITSREWLISFLLHLVCLTNLQLSDETLTNVLLTWRYSCVFSSDKWACGRQLQVHIMRIMLSRCHRNHWFTRSPVKHPFKPSVTNEDGKNHLASRFYSSVIRWIFFIERLTSWFHSWIHIRALYNLTRVFSFISYPTFEYYFWIC